MVRSKKFFASVGVSALLMFGAATPAAMAQPNQDGLVNVAIGDVTILEDVNIGVAAQVAAQVCGVRVGPVAVLATQVDASGGQRTVCNSAQGPVTIRQN
jgi:hypothetical protein